MGSKRPTARRNTPDDPDEFRLTLVEHLEELRDRIIRSAMIIAAGWLIGWFIEPQLYVYLNRVVVAAIVPAVGKGIFSEVFHQTTEAFMLKLRLSFFIGLGLATPFLVLQVWAFIAPGLKKQERKPVEKLVPWMVLLFFMGVGCAWAVTPNALAWFADYVNQFPGVKINQEAGTMVFFIIKMLLAFGLAFQLPIIVYALGAIGLLTADTLAKYWRHCASMIFFLAALLTPSNDPITMLMMAIPMVILFMISVWAVRVTERRQLKKHPVESQTSEDSASADDDDAMIE